MGHGGTRGDGLNRDATTWDSGGLRVAPAPSWTVGVRGGGVERGSSVISIFLRNFSWVSPKPVMVAKTYPFLLCKINELQRKIGFGSFGYRP